MNDQQTSYQQMKKDADIMINVMVTLFFIIFFIPLLLTAKHANAGYKRRINAYTRMANEYKSKLSEELKKDEPNKRNVSKFRKLVNDFSVTAYNLRKLRVSYNITFSWYFFLFLLLGYGVYFLIFIILGMGGSFIGGIIVFVKLLAYFPFWIGLLLLYRGWHYCYYHLLENDIYDISNPKLTKEDIKRYREDHHMVNFFYYINFKKARWVNGTDHYFYNDLEKYDSVYKEKLKKEKENARAEKERLKEEARAEKERIKKATEKGVYDPVFEIDITRKYESKLVVIGIYIISIVGTLYIVPHTWFPHAGHIVVLGILVGMTITDLRKRYIAKKCNDYLKLAEK